jgi:hypothetical protein
MQEIQQRMTATHRVSQIKRGSVKLCVSLSFSVELSLFAGFVFRNGIISLTFINFAK